MEYIIPVLMGYFMGIVSFAMFSTRQNDKYYERGYRQGQIDGELH